MKKLFIGFFLLIGGFFLGGHGRLEAHACKAENQQASVESPQASGLTGISLEQEGLPLIHRPASSHEAVIKVYATEVREEEEDEEGDHHYGSSRKHSSSYYTTSILLAQTLGYFLSVHKRSSSFCRYFSYTSSDRYLAFLVFRI